MGCQWHARDAFLSGKNPEKAASTQGHVWKREKPLAPTRVDPRTFRAVASRPISVYLATPAAVSTSSFYFSVNRLNEKLTMSKNFPSAVEPKLCP